MFSCSIPTLLVIYKRHNTLKKVIESLQIGKPKKIYCIGDGPKSKAEEMQVIKTRQVLGQIDWPCQVYTKFAASNQGLKKTIENGLDWVLSCEKYAVVIEDDIVLSPSFFPFMEHVLNKYINHPQIAGASGYNPVRAGSANSYHFSRFHRSWGWGVYARSWGHNSKPFYKKEGKNFFLDLYFALIAHLTKLGKIDTWDYRWTLANLNKNNLFVVPNRNLVTNIGAGEYATHTRVIPRSLLPKMETLQFPLEDPVETISNNGLDNQFARLVYLNYRSILGALKEWLWH